MSGGDISYEAIIMLALFLVAQWYAARIFLALKLPTIPIEIGVGMLFGPHGLDLIPKFSHNYSPLRLLGFLGVGIVIFESGMHLSIKKVFNWSIGPHVLVVATLGTLLPIVAGLGIFTALGFDAYPSGLAAGFSLAPTSVGISLTLLSRAKQLNSRMGQIIMSAAFLDDIFSIICLVVMINLAGGDLHVANHVIIPLVSAFAFVTAGAVGSVFLPMVFPRILDGTAMVLSRFEVSSRSMTFVDEIHMFYLILSYWFFSWIGDMIGSALLGCFVAGMLFATVPRSHQIWEKQFKRITRWLLRLFFTCTVAFSINISQLFTASSFLKGMAMAVLPCLLTKVMSAVFVGPERFVVGIAMMARGEFAYLVAEEAHGLEMLSDSEYAIVIWALLWATVVAPMSFDKVLKKFINDEYARKGTTRASRIGGDAFSGESSFVIRYFGKNQLGMVREMIESLHVLGFDVKRSVTENNGHFGMGTFEVYPRLALAYQNKYGDTITLAKNERAHKKYMMATDLSDEKLDEVAKYLNETLADPHSQIVFEPSSKEGEFLRIVEIEIFGTKYRTVQDDISIALINDCNLDIERMVEVEPSPGEEAEGHEYTVYYCRKHVENGATGAETGGLPSPASAGKLASGSITPTGGGRRPSTPEAVQSDGKPRPLSVTPEPPSLKLSHAQMAAKGARLSMPKEIPVKSPGSGKAILGSSGASAEDPVAAAAACVAGDISKSADGDPSAVSAEDCLAIRAIIRGVYNEKNLTGCDCLVRAIHETAVVYSANDSQVPVPDPEPAPSSAAASAAPLKTAHVVSEEVGGDEGVIQGKKKFSFTELDMKKSLEAIKSLELAEKARLAKEAKASAAAGSSSASANNNKGYSAVEMVANAV